MFFALADAEQEAEEFNSAYDSFIKHSEQL